MPENTIKFVVGVLLTSFGIFWAGEGIGVDWPGGDVALLGVLAFVTLSSFVLVRVLRHERAALPAVRSRRMSRLDGVRTASGTTSSSVTTGGSRSGSSLPSVCRRSSSSLSIAAWWLLPLAVIALLAESVLRAARGS